MCPVCRGWLFDLYSTVRLFDCSCEHGKQVFLSLDLKNKLTHTRSVRAMWCFVPCFSVWTRFVSHKGVLHLKFLLCVSLFFSTMSDSKLCIKWIYFTPNSIHGCLRNWPLQYLLKCRYLLQFSKWITYSIWLMSYHLIFFLCIKKRAHDRSDKNSSIDNKEMFRDGEMWRIKENSTVYLIDDQLKSGKLR